MMCGACAAELNHFDESYVLFKYNDSSKSIIHKLKYNDKPHIAKYLSKLIANNLDANIKDRYDFIIPVPLHPKRLRKRFFNQSALIAQHLGEATGICFRANLLEKKRYDVPQMTLSKEMRLKNVKGSFKVNDDFKDKIKGKNIVLVDDVYTTGATLNECCKVLKKAGCENVMVITAAKVI